MLGGAGLDDAELHHFARPMDEYSSVDGFTNRALPDPGATPSLRRTKASHAEAAIQAPFVFSGALFVFRPTVSQFPIPVVGRRIAEKFNCVLIFRPKNGEAASIIVTDHESVEGRPNIAIQRIEMALVPGEIMGCKINDTKPFEGRYQRMAAITRFEPSDPFSDLACRTLGLRKPIGESAFGKVFPCFNPHVFESDSRTS
jgi:hypothetical protein